MNIISWKHNLCVLVDAFNRGLIDYFYYSPQPYLPAAKVYLYTHRTKGKQYVKMSMPSPVGPQYPRRYGNTTINSGSRIDDYLLRDRYSALYKAQYGGVL